MKELSPLAETPQVLEVLSPPSWRQGIVILADGSLSMTLSLLEPDSSMGDFLPVRTKAAAVDVASRALVNRLQSGRKAANFRLAVVNFHERVSGERPFADLLDVPAGASYDPTAGGTGGTAIHAGLERAQALVSDFYREEAASGLPASVVVLLLSDGEDSNPQQTVRAAETLKNLGDGATFLACCYFGTKGQPSTGSTLLQTIATSPSYYDTVFDAEQLRRFFHASVTMAATATAGAASESVA